MQNLDKLGGNKVNPQKRGCVLSVYTESSCMNAGVSALFLQPCLWDALPGVLLLQGCQNEEREGICECDLWLSRLSRPTMTSFCLVCLFSSFQLSSLWF